MQSLDNLLAVCYLFIQGKFEIEEFQSRLITAAIPENISRQFASALADADNKMEEIIFCYAPSSRKQYADKIANDLIQETLLEQKRLQESSSHKHQ